MILTNLFGIVFLDNLKGEHHKQSKDYKFISDIKEMLNIFIKTPYISILFFFSLIFINIFVQYWQWIFKDFNIAITYFELGIVFSLILLSQWFASFLFTKLNTKINFYILLFLSISLLSVSIFFHPQKEISIILLCIIFYIIKYTLMHAEVLLHDNIRDKLRATYESFLSTAVRLSLLLFFYFSAALVDRFGFLSLVYIFLIFLVFYLYTLFFKGRTKKALL
ncbi:MFS family permease [Bartonella silvatica]|uniref:MFS family permease n=1 Tax=Bartonella silvatica TaxID=357760 RepID=A0ABV2HI21_9HYPH